jgi:hypothetical protein
LDERADRKEDALESRNSGRRWAIWAWTSFVLFAVTAATVGLAWPAWEAEGDEIGPALGGIALLSIAFGRFPPIQNHLLPAIEIADKTPGRRQLARATFVLGPLGALLFQHLS